MCCAWSLLSQVFHLEDIVEQTGYMLEKDSEYSQRILEDEEEVNISVTLKGGKTQQHQVRPQLLWEVFKTVAVPVLAVKSSRTSFVPKGAIGCAAIIKQDQDT